MSSALYLNRHHLSHFFRQYPSRMTGLVMLPANFCLYYSGVANVRPEVAVGGLLSLAGSMALLRWGDRPGAGRRRSFRPWHDVWRFCGLLSLLNAVNYAASGACTGRPDTLFIALVTYAGALFLIFPDSRPQAAPNSRTFNHAWRRLLANPTRASAWAYRAGSLTGLLAGLCGGDLTRVVANVWSLGGSALQMRISAAD